VGQTADHFIKIRWLRKTFHTPKSSVL